MKKNKISSNIIFISGNFNIIHPGHIRLFNFAKNYGSQIIVGVNSDKIAGKNAYINEKLRIENLKNNSIIDKVILISNSLEIALKKIRPDIIIKGKEHEQGYNIEDDIIKKYGGKLIFATGNITFSSAGIVNNELLLSKRVINKNERSYQKRHKISKNFLINVIKKFKEIKVIVVGDSIVDEYINCEALGMSQEDPTLAVAPVGSEFFLGGGAIVAAHCRSLGANVKFISVTGKDEISEFIKSNLDNFKVKSHLFKDISRVTSLKQRYRCKGKTLLRVNNLQHNSISPIIQKKILDLISRNIKSTNIILLSDFNYGCLPQSLVDKITKIAKQHNVKIVADSQSSSQIGNIARYKNMDLITPTEREARVSLRNNQDGLEKLGNNLISESKAKNMLLKLGEEGVIIYSNNIKNKIKTDQIDAIGLNVVDVAGAGDVMFVAASLALAKNQSIWVSTYLGSLAAAIQVSRVGNTPLTNEELVNFI